MQIVTYSDSYKQQVIDFIVGIQQLEFNLAISAEDQPDLKQVAYIYQRGNGNFWLAEEEGSVIGTIALIDIGNLAGALRKMFVHPDWRGKDKAVAQTLMGTVFEHCGSRDIQAIYLGTIDIMKAAHRFYEKNGFSRIEKNDLPSGFPIMPVDNVFYKLSFEKAS